MMRPLWIVGATAYLPDRPTAVRSVKLEAGRVAAWVDGVPEAGALIDCDVLDAKGLWLLPGFWDVHVHLRDPGQTYKEDIASGTHAAVAGGVTAVVAMGNTKPPIDTPEVARYVVDRAAQVGWCRVYPVSAATMGLAGEELAPYHQMAAAGCVAVSDDGATIASAGVMRRSMEYAKSVGLPLMPHCEDRSVRAGGVMNAGPNAVALGYPGNPREAEEICIARDIHLAKLTGAHLHIQHLTTAGGLELVRRAKDAGLSVTTEVCPHHVFLTDAAVAEYGTHAKMAPPLRAEADVAALRQGLADGSIDCWATDHAPHARYEKDLPFEAAPDGIIGLETLLPLGLRLVREGVLDMPRLLARAVTAPRRLIGIDEVPLAVGSVADLVLIDPDSPWTYDPEHGQSLSANTPYGGWTFPERVVLTLVDGVVRWDPDGRLAGLGRLPVCGVARNLEPHR